jgi:hypothetical protein
MNREHTAYSMTGYDSRDFYERHEKMHSNPGAMYYGYQLVETKRVRTGFDLKVSFFTRYPHWKPELDLKYNKVVRWLWFQIRFEFDYSEDFDHVVKDWAAQKKEAQASAQQQAGQPLPTAAMP